MIVTILGFIAGIMIGLTGTGGGVILTPLLLIFTPFPAVVVIGTDIVNGAVTKLLGVIEHRRLGQVHWRLAGLLISGSVPGTLAGIVFLTFLKSHLETSQLDHFLRILLAVALFGVGLFLPFVRGGQIRVQSQSLDFHARGRAARLVAVGALVGFLVALTSIGSGSLLMLFLLLLIPLPVAGLVGTDIAFGLATMALAGSFHVWMGHFNGMLFLQLVAGS
ncbi:MAG: sulfite exporter TauE/SafE family protein, partial [Acidobacteria bacterium]|nr:sulfite exporter TauE/SafE family protein [Acidobacteriota bacterium]